MSEKVIGLDIDGTTVKHVYPELGEPVPGAIEGIKFLQSKGYKITVFTMRSGQQLQEAIEFLKFHGIQPYGINQTPGQTSWTSSPKAYAHFYIDDAAIGCPLIHPKVGRHYVDWPKVIEIILDREQKEAK